jgi:hypothetical protein
MIPAQDTAVLGKADLDILFNLIYGLQMGFGYVQIVAEERGAEKRLFFIFSVSLKKCRV